MSRNGQNNRGGRPKGSKNLSTIEREGIMEELKDRYYKSAHALHNARLSLAVGVQTMYRIEQDEVTKKIVHVIVSDPKEVGLALDEIASGAKTHYYLTMKEPDIRAIDSAENRILGRPVEMVQVKGVKTLKVDF